MNLELLSDRLFETLINGDRPLAQKLVRMAVEETNDAEGILTEVLWPLYEHVETLSREDKITRLAHRFATRQLRVLVDQTSCLLEQAERVGRTVLAVCGPSDPDELGAQIAVDLLEANGFSVRFPGGDIPADEVLAQVHQTQPDVLLFFASSPSDLPEIRGIIDHMREIQACPNTQIVVGGGVFTRAEGLAEEIGADLWATHPIDLVGVMLEAPQRRAEDEQRSVGRKRRLAA